MQVPVQVVEGSIPDGLEGRLCWANKGNVNVVHYLYILDVELAVLN